MTTLNKKKLAKVTRNKLKSLHGTEKTSENKKEMRGNKSEMN